MPTTSPDLSSFRPRQPRRRRIVFALVLLCYGVFAVWRVFPRFDARLLGQWRVGNGVDADTTWFFHNRGAGEQWNAHSRRTFRWWICGNLLVKHENRGSRSANISAALNYAFRTLLFLGPPERMTEFEIDRLDQYGAQFTSRPRQEQPGSRETLVLRRNSSL